MQKNEKCGDRTIWFSVDEPLWRNNNDRGYDRWNRYVFSLRWNTGSDGADVMSFGKLFHSVGPAVKHAGIIQPWWKWENLASLAFRRRPTLTRKIQTPSAHKTLTDRYWWQFRFNKRAHACVRGCSVLPLATVQQQHSATHAWTCSSAYGALQICLWYDIM